MTDNDNSAINDSGDANSTRRTLLQVAAITALTQLANTTANAQVPVSPEPAATGTAPAADSPASPPTPTKTTGKTPGKPGDFDFLTGNWKIWNRRLKAGAPRGWDEFPGEATVWAILGGVCSIEELRIPARNFSGMGLRVLDVEKRVWSDYWMNAKAGVLGSAGVRGSFENGAGVFISDDTEDGKPVLYRGLWDGISKTHCRWSQSVSRDGGKTWNDLWLMQWTRV